METLGGEISFEGSLEHDIGMDDFYVGSYQDHIFTEGASTCIVTATLNQDSETSALGHFSSISIEKSYDTNSQDQFSNFLRDLTNSDTPETSKLWVLGGGPFIEKGVDTVKPDREHVVKKIIEFAKNNNLGNDSVNFIWSQPGVGVDVESQQGVLTATYFSKNDPRHNLKKVEYRV